MKAGTALCWALPAGSKGVWTFETRNEPEGGFAAAIQEGDTPGDAAARVEAVERAVREWATREVVRIGLYRRGPGKGLPIPAEEKDAPGARLLWTLTGLYGAPEFCNRPLWRGAKPPWGIRLPVQSGHKLTFEIEFPEATKCPLVWAAEVG